MTFTGNQVGRLKSHQLERENSSSTGAIPCRLLTVSRLSFFETKEMKHGAPGRALPEDIIKHLHLAEKNVVIDVDAGKDSDEVVRNYFCRCKTEEVGESLIVRLRFGMI